MAKKQLYNEEIDGVETAASGEDAAPCDDGQCANVADEASSASDTMTEPAAEESAKDASAEAAEWRDKYVRLHAEFDNYRKRTLREKMDLVQSGGADVLKAMLPVVDDVNRALDAMEKSDDLAALRDGVRLIAMKFDEVLRSKGVTEIEAKGQELDVDRHEAVAKFAAGEENKGKIIDVVQRGYMLGDKVLRFAKVVVGD